MRLLHRSISSDSTAEWAAQKLGVKAGYLQKTKKLNVYAKDLILITNVPCRERFTNF